MVSLKNRLKIINEEIIEKKGKRIYIERKINEIMKTRYTHGEINMNNHYFYEKFNALVKNRIYVPVRNVWQYVKQVGFISVFELYQELEKIIRIHHLPRRKSSLYTKQEKQQMENFIKSRKIIEDRGLFVVA